MGHPERIVPDETEPGIVALHRKRYEFAERWCTSKEVLDLACGVGYGTAHLAAIASRTVGVDASEEAIAYARRRYAAGNAEFHVMDATRLAFADAAFDVVCAFEALEHFADPDTAVGEATRVLRGHGTLIASTPRAARTTHSPDNPFHRVEFSRHDFEALMRRHFGDVQIYGQRRLRSRRHRLLRRLDVLGLRRRVPIPGSTSRLLGSSPTATVTSREIVIERDHVEQAEELIAVCTLPRR